MRSVVTILSVAFMSSTLFAQSPVLQVHELTLSNGMQVWLNEDHSQPKVFGTVVVRAGAKDCPDTGIAHYFEHIMFKGTDRIGTVDYEAERPWLDSISAQYDRLSQTNATAMPGAKPQEIEARRMAIQRHINELSLKAADYVIPNEFSRLISLYGGSGLNAATGPDATYYYNQFLPQYLTQWCWLNSERLLHPVFRGFQGELENVYEEKNRSADALGGALDKVLKAVFKDQPYAYPVLGSTESLKNPRLSDMEAFYRKYYVAPNMCLMLCGDIRPDSTLTTLLEQTFGRVPTGPVPQRAVSSLPAITQGERTEIRLPIPIIKAKALVFSAPTAFDADAPAMMVANQLLYNEGAGMLDSLTNEHRVMMAGVMTFDQLADAAVNGLFVVPNILGKMKKAEAVSMQQLQRLMDGDFTDEQLEMQRRRLLMEAERGLETIDDRAEHMIDVYSRGYSWPQYLQQIEALRRVTRADVVRVARKYYGGNYHTLAKKYGTDDKETLKQPGYTPVQPKNVGAKSAFAQWLEQLPKGDAPIRTVDLDRDVVRRPLTDHATLYYKENPVNDIFTFTLRYHNGTHATPLLEQTVEYLNTLGTDSLRKQQLEAAWQQLGVTMTFSGGDERTAFELTGRDSQLAPALRLLAHFMAHPQGDAQALKKLKQSAKVERKSFGKQKDDVLPVMVEYVRYGQQSQYLHQPSLKELKALTSDTLLALFSQLQRYDCDIVYCGRLPMEQVAAVAQHELPLDQCQLPRTDTYRVSQSAPAAPTVYFYHVPKSRQNYVCSYELLPPQTEPNGLAAARLWARYMGGGMSGVLFQNIREFRSLAYTTLGMMGEPKLASHAADPLLFLTITGTQADKTLQVVDAVDSLLHFMPMKPENIEAARQEILSGVQNSYPTFRTIGFYVANCLMNGYSADPNRQLVEALPHVSQDDVKCYQQQNVSPNNRVWVVIGDRKLTDLKALERYGRVVELRREDIVR